MGTTTPKNIADALARFPHKKNKPKRTIKPFQYNYLFNIPNTFEGLAFLKQARHYLNKVSYRFESVATEPKSGQRNKNGYVATKDAKVLHIYTRFKNGRARPLGVKNIKALRREVLAQDDLADTLMNEIERLEVIVADQRQEIRALQSESEGQNTRLLTAVRNRINAITNRS